MNLNMLDTRELAEELDDLEERAERVVDEDTGEYDAEPLDDADTERMLALQELRDEVGEEWRHGETLIPEDEFEDYAQSVADDIMPSSGARELANQWPFNCIDWERAARELAYDYTSVTFDGTDYYFRSS